MTFGTIVSGISGGLIGWPLGTALRGGDPQWGIAAAGVGLLLISIPIYSGGAKSTIKAVGI